MSQRRHTAPRAEAAAAAALALVLVTLPAAHTLCTLSSGRTYFASSQYDSVANPTFYDPASAGDGVSASFYNSDTSDFDPYLGVDLGRSCIVHSFSIMNRADCCAGTTTCCNTRLDSSTVTVLNTKPTGIKSSMPADGFCWQQPTGLHLGVGATWNIKCYTMQIGRYVVLQNHNPSSTQYFLNVAEFKVFGYPNTPGTITKLVGTYRGSSTYLSSATYAPAKAGDGSGATYFNSDTGDSIRPWLGVDFGSTKIVTSVSITNRAADSCSTCPSRLRAGYVNVLPFSAGPDNALVINGTVHPYDEGICWRQSVQLGAGATISPTCRQVIGRYVYLVNGNLATTNDYYLNIAEFRAYGYTPNLSTC